MFESPANVSVYDLTYSPTSSASSTSLGKGIASPRLEGAAAPRAGSRTAAGSAGLVSPGDLSVSPEHVASGSVAESTPGASRPQEGRDGDESGGDLNNHSVIEIADDDKSDSESDEDVESMVGLPLAERLKRGGDQRKACFGRSLSGMTLELPLEALDASVE